MTFCQNQKKSSNSVHNLKKKKPQLLGNLFAIFLGGMETSYHSTICPGVFGTSISCGLKEDVVILDLLLFDADGKSEAKNLRTQMVAKHGDESHGRINPYKMSF